VKTPKKAGPPRVPFAFSVRKLPEAMKKGMNDDDVGVKTVDSKRKSEVEAKSVKEAVPRAIKRVQK
jgi:recombination DNA repair RAD52 pathway protein